MKSTLILILFVSILPFGCKQGTNTSSAEDRAEMKFTETTFNYGQIKQGSPGICFFEFTNSSNIPLVINEVKTTCGCTSPEWPKDPIMQGDKGIIKIKYNTNIRGTFRKTITVYANTMNSPVNLKITGEVITEKTE